MPSTTVSAPDTSRGTAIAPAGIAAAVNDELEKIQIIDVHTHLFKPALGSLGLWGIDELLTYHYLEGE
ncbi:MAG: hypothetical protein ACRD34_04385, partial [Bryobacteraceae bacterium]